MAPGLWLSGGSVWGFEEGLRSVGVGFGQGLVEIMCGVLNPAAG
jgi:hypothetical protein